MSARAKRSLLLALLLITAGTLSLLAVRRASHKPMPPLEVALWYWHQPFRIPPAEAKALDSAGVSALFVRAGTFRRDTAGAIRLILPQVWASRAEGFGIHLVFRFDNDLARDFTRSAPEEIVSALKEIIPQERERAEKAGLHVVGVQFDIDCPTSRLPQYARLLQQLRPVCTPPNGVLSVTALPTWFSSKDIRQVMESVNFTVPQYYEAQVAKDLAQFTTVSSIKRMERGLQAAGKTELPFRVGLPAYGHALVYDSGNQLVGPYRDMGIREVARQPFFRWQASTPANGAAKPATPDTYIGEDIHDFAVTGETDQRGHGNYRLRFDLPTSALVAQHLALVKAQRPPNCRGVILFRYPEPGEMQTLPLATLTAVLRGEQTAPKIEAEWTVKTSPWEAIETGRAADRLPKDLYITLKNKGTASSFAAPDAVTLTLTFDRPGIEDITTGPFDIVETFTGALTSASGFSPMRSSMARANIIRLQMFHLAAGETVRAGPIRLGANGPTRARGEWTVRSEGGFETLRGEIVEIKLDSGSEGERGKP